MIKYSCAEPGVACFRLRGRFRSTRGVPDPVSVGRTPPPATETITYCIERYTVRRGDFTRGWRRLSARRSFSTPAKRKPSLCCRTEWGRRRAWPPGTCLRPPRDYYINQILTNVACVRPGQQGVGLRALVRRSFGVKSQWSSSGEQRAGGGRGPTCRFVRPWRNAPGVEKVNMVPLYLFMYS